MPWLEGCHACFMKKTQTDMPERNPDAPLFSLEVVHPTHNAKLWKIHSALSTYYLSSSYLILFLPF